MNCLIFDKISNSAVQEKFEKIKSLFQGLLNDRSIPRDIKRVIQKGIDLIKESKDDVKNITSNIISLINEISLDNNLPYHGRSTINRCLTILKTLND